MPTIQPQSKYETILGSKLHYLEAGSGDPILFLHGIPTSSYLWRHIIPYLDNSGHCIAPDLIGCGDSEKPDIEYTIDDHIKYFSSFIEKLNLKNITLVLHGWGSVIGLNYAMQHPENCKGLVLYEAFLNATDQDMSLPYQQYLLSLKNQLNSDQGQYTSHLFDKLLPQLHELSANELAKFKEIFQGKQASKLIKQYLKEIPDYRAQGKIEQMIKRYTLLLQKSPLPKLLLYSVPGFLTSMPTIMWAKENLPHLELMDIGEALHLGQLNQTEKMGKTISIWLQGVEQYEQYQATN